MKRLEQLADEHKEENACGNLDGCSDRCFESGFRKARELAAQEVDHLGTRPARCNLSIRQRIILR